MKRLCAGLVLAGILVSASARAEDTSNNVQELYRNCIASDEDYHKVYCMGVVTGISNSLGANGYLLKHLTKSDAALMSKVSTCGPKSLGADIQAFVNWAQKHPERWNDHFSVGVTEALRESWPCSPPYK